MKRIRVEFQGFKLGYVCADQIARQFNGDTVVGSAALHALKNIATNQRVLNEVNAVAINGEMYAPAQEVRK